MSDNLDVPNCQVHLESLELVDNADDGNDARWECGVPGCTWVQIT